MKTAEDVSTEIDVPTQIWTDILIVLDIPDIDVSLEEVMQALEASAEANTPSRAVRAVQSSMLRHLEKCNAPREPGCTKCGCCTSKGWLVVGVNGRLTANTLRLVQHVGRCVHND